MAPTKTPPVFQTRIILSLIQNKVLSKFSEGSLVQSVVRGAAQRDGRWGRAGPPRTLAGPGALPEPLLGGGGLEAGPRGAEMKTGEGTCELFLQR